MSSIINDINRLKEKTNEDIDNNNKESKESKENKESNTVITNKFVLKKTIHEDVSPVKNDNDKKKLKYKIDKIFESNSEIKKLKNEQDSNTIRINVGGEYECYSDINLFKDFNFNLSFKNNISKGKTLFLDMNYCIFDLIMEIIRINPKQTAVLINNYIVCKEDIDIVNYYCNSIFGDDWTIIKTKIFFILTKPDITEQDKTSNFNFSIDHYKVNSKEIDRGLKNIKLEKKDKNKVFWKPELEVFCYVCGVVNDGKMWKIKYSNSKRNDKYVVNGHFAVCRKCDPEGDKRY